MNTNSQNTFVLSIFAAISLFAGAWYLTPQSELAGFEAAIFRIAYGFPDAAQSLFILLTQLGNPYLVVALILLGVGFKKSWRGSLLVLLYKMLLGMSLVGLAKNAINRPRPFEILSDVNSLDLVVGGMGFPSGHTATATILGFALAQTKIKNAKTLAALLVLIVGYSRIYLGVHAPLDLVAGFAVGWFTHLLVDALINKRRARASQHSDNSE